MTTRMAPKELENFLVAIHYGMAEEQAADYLCIPYDVLHLTMQDLELRTLVVDLAVNAGGAKRLILEAVKKYKGEKYDN